MSDEALRREIVECLVKAAPDVDVSRLDPERSFRDQWEMDSLDFLNFVLELEKRLRLRVPEEDYPKLSCLNGCLAYLEGRRRDPASNQ
jgi:acyl carrier protein